MTRIDFYLINSDDPQARLRIACRLVEKAYHQNHQIFIHCSDPTTAAEFDDMLWNLRETAFIPHANLHIDSADNKSPILIGVEPPEHSHDLMINLDKTVAADFGRYTRVLELVCQGDPEWVQIGRDNYKHYRKIGYPLHTHNI
jgi:DNA polymerase-3 subunit chi